MRCPDVLAGNSHLLRYFFEGEVLLIAKNQDQRLVIGYPDGRTAKDTGDLFPAGLKVRRGFGPGGECFGKCHAARLLEQSRITVRNRYSSTQAGNPRKSRLVAGFLLPLSSNTGASNVQTPVALSKVAFAVG